MAEEASVSATVSVVKEERRRILVAVDEGEESIHALTWCLQNVVSRNGKDTVVLVYAMAPQAAYGPADGIGYLFSSDMIQSMEKYAKDVANSVIDKAKGICSGFPNIEVESKVERGDPRDVICDMVENLKGDLLVMGTHGYGLIKRAFLGSVSSHCAQNANCPVLIVKKPKTKH